jgi:SNF2 family DNA or RNA helicase
MSELKRKIKARSQAKATRSQVKATDDDDAEEADFHLDLEVFKTALSEKNLQTKQHQLDGVKWCVKNEKRGNVIGNKTIHGGIVADEMGLGKTIQMVGVIITNFVLHTLIIVPKAILEQWQREIFKLTSHNSFVYHGNNRKKYEELKTSPIVITTYGMIANTSSELFNIKWDRVVFDEAHHLRNKNTKICIGAMKLKADIKWAVTGTPIQNKESDFYNICGALGIEKGTFKKNKAEEWKKIYMKRTKKDVGINLEDVNYETININWDNLSEKKLSETIHSKTQFELPKRYRTRQQEQIESALTLVSSSSTTSHPPLPSKVSTILPLIIKAKQMCIFPALINKTQQPQELSIIKGTTYTTKIDSLVKILLERKDNERPKLIFCHFKGEIDIIKQRLEKDFEIQVIDGRTTDKHKKEILKNAASSAAKTHGMQTRQMLASENGKKNKILILQIQTGCEGLNLQEYNEVYFVSPHWNPAVESQAIARCHRIGQTQSVDVFRFIMTWNDKEFKSMDEYCEQLQHAKQKVYSNFFERETKLIR